jgi:hypothetical protein
VNQSLVRLIKRCAEYVPVDSIDDVAKGLRGTYVLYNR